MIANNGYISDLLNSLGLSDRLGPPVAILIILVVAFLLSRSASRASHRWVEALIARSALPGRTARSAGRARTLAGVSASMIRIVVWTLAGLLVLGQLSIDLAPFIAGASIVGFALGFGAQSLVKDFLSGFFILAEDQFGIGDVVTLGDVSGTVEEVSLRVTRIRGTDGTVWFIPNGEIKKVGNSAKDWSRAIVDVVLSSGADAAAATAAIADEISGFGDDPGWADSLLERPEVLGVEDIGLEGTTVRVSVRTLPEKRASVARELRARVGARLRKDGYLTAKDPASGD